MTPHDPTQFATNTLSDDQPGGVSVEGLLLAFLNGSALSDQQTGQLVQQLATAARDIRTDHASLINSILVRDFDGVVRKEIARKTASPSDSDHDTSRAPDNNYWEASSTPDDVLDLLRRRMSARIAIDELEFRALHDRP